MHYRFLRTYHFGLALTKIATEHGLHDVAAGRQHRLVSGADAIVQFEDDVGEKTLVQTDVLEPPLQEVIVVLVRRIGCDERVLG